MSLVQCFYFLGTINIISLPSVSPAVMLVNFRGITVKDVHSNGIAECFE